MKNTVFILLTVLIIAGSIVGSILKIMHTPGADFLLASGLISGFLFAILALSEILLSPIQKTEKVMWVIGFIFLNWIAVILYMAVGRNRILLTNKNSSLT